MAKKHAVTQKGLLKPVMIGMVTAVAVTMISLLVLTALVEHQTLKEESCVLWGHAVQFVAAFLGGVIAQQFTRSKKWTIAACVAGLYIVVLLGINIVVMANGFSGVLMSLAMIVAGSISAVPLMAQKKGVRHTAKYRYR